MNSFIRIFITGALVVNFAGTNSLAPSNLLSLPIVSPTRLPLAITFSPGNGSAWFSNFLEPLFAGQPPVASDDAYQTDEDQTITITAPGVLQNDTDTDPGGETLTAALDTSPAHGALTLQPDGSFEYIPDPDFQGIDSFTYTAGDGDSPSLPATVTITINPVNDAPVAVSDSLDVDEDHVLTLPEPGLLGNDGDVDGDLLTAVLITGSGPHHGSLTLNPDGSLAYSPDDDYSGSDTFQYRAYDGDLTSAPTTVTITVAPVNDPPRVQNDAYTVLEDGNLNVPASGVLANDIDIESQPLTAVLASGTTNGDLTLNSNGSFTYTPDSDFAATDSFTYRANDGQDLSIPATVTITITPQNDAPVAVADSYTTAEDTPLAQPAPGILGNDTDIDLDTLTASLVTGPAHGTFTLNPNGSFTYTPATNENGPDSFTYRAYDGSLYSSPVTVTLNVTAVNDAPVAVTDSFSTAEDTPLVQSAPGVLGNDTDIDLDTLTADLVTGPAHGSLTLNANGSFTYTPTGNYNGPDSFTYRAYDSSAYSNNVTVSLNVTAANDAPVAVADSYTTAEDTPLTQAAPGVLSNDTDIDLDTLTADLVTGPAHGTLTLNPNGSFTYTPTGNYNGPDSFTYRAYDGSLYSGPVTVTLNVTAVNDAPVAAADSYTTAEDTPLTQAIPGVLSNDTDIDLDTLTADLVNGPAHGTLTLNPNGSFTYTPTGNYNGPDSFTYRAYDGSLYSGPVTVTLNITVANDAPVAVADSYTTAEDTPLVQSAPGVLGNDTDIDLDTLTADLVTGPTNGALSLNPDGSFTYTPTGNYNGSDSFTYRAYDGSLYSGPVTVTLNVTAVNDAPVAVADSYTTAEDIPLTRPAPGVLGNDTDVESNPLTADLVTGPSQGSLTLNADGSFTYTPTGNFSGEVSFTYRAYDGSLYSGPVTVALNVTPVNDVPTAAADTYNATEDATLSVPASGVLANDTDIEGNPLTAALVTGPEHGILVLAQDGSFTYTSSANYNGPDSFTYTANDAGGSSTPATVTLTIAAVNDAPVSVAESYTTAEDTPLSVAAPGLLANDTDIDSATLTAAIDQVPAHGTVTINPNGSFTYTPTANYHGQDTFSYHASDGSLSSIPVTVNLTVTPVNDVPAATPQSLNLNEDTPLTITLTGTDIDGDPLTYLAGQTGYTQPAHGQITLVSPGVYTYTPALNYFGLDTFSFTASDNLSTSPQVNITLNIQPVNDAPVGVNDSAYTIAEETQLMVSAPAGVLSNDTDVDSTSLTAVLATSPANGLLGFTSTGSFSYTPNTDFYGTDTFTYRASDGFLSSGLTTVTITVTNVNDAPVALDDNYTINEDIALIQPAPGLQSNDFDVDRIDTLSVVLNSNPAHGTLVMQANGAFTYTPVANYNGTDFFTYHLWDGLANSTVRTVTINITAINDIPITTGDNYAVSKGGVLHVDLTTSLLQNDRDIEASPLRATLLTIPSRGVISEFSEDGTFTYTTYPNATGPVTFTYSAVDEQGGISPPTVVIIDVVIPTDIEIAWLAPLPKTDPNKFAGYWVGTETIELRASFNNCPPAHECAIRYYRLDKTLPPTDPNRFVDIGTGFAPDYSIQFNTSDLSDGWNEIMAQAYDLEPFNPSDPDFHGIDTFTYRAYDGFLSSNPATVTIEITPEVINPGSEEPGGIEPQAEGFSGPGPDAGDAPIANDDAYTVSEDTVLSVTAPGVLSNDSDAESDSLTTAQVIGPAHGTLTLNPDGSFIYAPTENYNGIDSFTYRANDGSSPSNIATVSITVGPVNDLPVAVDDDDYSTPKRSTLTVNLPGVLANDIDVDSPLSAALLTNPSFGVVDFKSNGSFKYTSFPVGASPRLSIFLYRYPYLRRLYVPETRR